jgi:hypothetical protein
MASKKAPAIPRRRYADFCNKIGTKRTCRSGRSKSTRGGFDRKLVALSELDEVRY